MQQARQQIDVWRLGRRLRRHDGNAIAPCPIETDSAGGNLIGRLAGFGIGDGIATHGADLTMLQPTPKAPHGVAADAILEQHAFDLSGDHEERLSQ